LLQWPAHDRPVPVCRKLAQRNVSEETFPRLFENIRLLQVENLSGSERIGETFLLPCGMDLTAGSTEKFIVPQRKE
jgi:hypothetical protein